MSAISMGIVSSKLASITTNSTARINCFLYGFMYLKIRSKSFTASSFKGHPSR